MKRLSWLVIVLAACGSSDRVDDFIGTWTYQAGASSMLDCDNNLFDLSGPLTGSFQIARGTSSDLIGVPDADDTCPPVRMDVDGDRASAQAGQTCVETVGTAPNTITVTGAVGTYTLTLDGAGTTITLDGRGSAMLTGDVHGHGRRERHEDRCQRRRRAGHEVARLDRSSAALTRGRPAARAVRDGSRRRVRRSLRGQAPFVS